MGPKQFFLLAPKKTTKAKNLNHKPNQVLRHLQEVEHNGEVSTL